MSQQRRASPAGAAGAGLRGARRELAQTRGGSRGTTMEARTSGSELDGACVSWWRSAPGRQHHVVIVGGGFGGLYAARALRGAPVQITLLDRHNHHTFQPLL